MPPTESIDPSHGLTVDAGNGADNNDMNNNITPLAVLVCVTVLSTSSMCPTDWIQQTKQFTFDLKT